MNKILLGTRIPEDLINEMRRYCRSRGIVMNYFVTQAIQEKLNKIKEEEEDILTIEMRKHESSLSEEEWNQYLKSRGMSV